MYATPSQAIWTRGLNQNIFYNTWRPDLLVYYWRNLCTWVKSQAAEPVIGTRDLTDLLVLLLLEKTLYMGEVTCSRTSNWNRLLADFVPEEAIWTG